MSGFDDAAVRELLARTQAQIAAIQASVAEAAETDADEFDAAEDFARRARGGDLGREWVVLQSRIDLDQTTLDAIMRGDDDSAEAQHVRERSHDNAEGLREFVRDEAEQDGRADPVVELEQQRERLLARGEALRQRIAEAQRDDESRATGGRS